MSDSISLKHPNVFNVWLHGFWELSTCYWNLIERDRISNTTRKHNLRSNIEDSNTKTEKQFSRARVSKNAQNLPDIRKDEITTLHAQAFCRNQLASVYCSYLDAKLEIEENRLLGWNRYNKLVINAMFTFGWSISASFIENNNHWRLLENKTSYFLLESRSYNTWSSARQLRDKQL